METYGCYKMRARVRNRRDRMIFKVLYQEDTEGAPTREYTQCLYVEAESEQEVYKYLEEREINIELIQPLNDAHLAYEKKSKYFILENE